MQKESDIRIAATTIVASISPNSVFALRQTPPWRLGEEDDIIGEFTQEVQNLTVHFAGLSQEEIIKIFHNWFKLTNFYCLRHMHSYS